MKDRSVILIAAVVLVLTLAWYVMPLPPDEPVAAPAKAPPSIAVPAPAPAPAAAPVIEAAPPIAPPKQ